MQQAAACGVQLPASRVPALHSRRHIALRCWWVLGRVSAEGARWALGHGERSRQLAAKVGTSGVAGKVLCQSII